MHFLDFADFFNYHFKENLLRFKGSKSDCSAFYSAITYVKKILPEQSSFKNS